MAFSTTTTTAPGPAVVGPYKLITGTFTNATGDVGGAISTGLNAIVACDVFITSHIGSQNPKFTVSGGTITIVTEDGADGNWWAIGR